MDKCMEEGLTVSVPNTNHYLTHAMNFGNLFFNVWPGVEIRKIVFIDGKFGLQTYIEAKE